MALSDKLQNCCRTMTELYSNELDCTTNLRQIYHRLPDPLQTKSRRSMKLYHDETGDREPSLKEMSAFITAQSQTENDPVYGRPSCRTVRFGNGTRHKKPLSNPKGTPAPLVTTLTRQVQTEGIPSTGRQSNEVTPKRGGQNVKHDSVQSELFKVCKDKHSLAKCGVFLMKSLNWWRQVARSNALCFRCLSTSHLKQKQCPVKKGCIKRAVPGREVIILCYMRCGRPHLKPMIVKRLLTIPHCEDKAACEQWNCEAKFCFVKGDTAMCCC